LSNYGRKIDIVFLREKGDQGKKESRNVEGWKERDMGVWWRARGRGRYPHIGVMKVGVMERESRKEGMTEETENEIVR